MEYKEPSYLSSILGDYLNWSISEMIMSLQDLYMILSSLSLINKKCLNKLKLYLKAFSLSLYSSMESFWAINKDKNLHFSELSNLLWRAIGKYWLEIFNPLKLISKTEMSNSIVFIMFLLTERIYKPLKGYKTSSKTANLNQR